MLFAVFLLFKTTFTDPGIIPRKEEENAENQAVAAGTETKALNLQSSLELQGRNAMTN
jgi:hypothetical protein